jgi:DNA repair protein RadC
LGNFLLKICWIKAGYLQHFKFDDAAVVLAGVNASREYFEPIFLEREQELTIVAFCDSKVRLHQLLSFPGCTASCQISLNDVFRHAFDSHCMIVAHNHPSGDPRPSDADMRFTRKLCVVAEAIDLTLLDHLVFAGGRMFSFRRAGLL